VVVVDHGGKVRQKVEEQKMGILEKEEEAAKVMVIEACSLQAEG
jgi:hypothetical protein